MATYKPTAGMKAEAERGLEWRREFGRGGTAVGIARARDIVNDKELSEDTVKRMFSFFSRHEVDKKAEGFEVGEDGYPSNGRIAWSLWGGDAGFRWSKSIRDRLEKEERGLRAITGAVRKGLQKKADDHNKKVGNVASKRTNLRTLSAVFNRGVGAYKTNPQSVRPSVKSPEQWAYARVNSYLYVLRNGKFRSGKHDTDLLPKGHPMSSKRGEDMSNDDLFEEMEERHIVDIQETDDTYVITYAKIHDEEEEQEERFSREDMSMRGHYMVVVKSIDEKYRRVMVGVSSEMPVD